MVIGILALQGCLSPHVKHLKALGVSARYVRLPADAEGIQGLILPGGESTTMIRVAKESGLWDLLPSLAKEIPFWGICAGSILMAQAVENPAQESLNAMDITVRRNAYGRQLESFTTELDVPGLAAGEKAEAVFIRAPKFLQWGSGVKVRSEVKGEAVFLDDGKHLVTAFHPELTENSWCHKIFLQRV